MTVLRIARRRPLGAAGRRCLALLLGAALAPLAAASTAAGQAIPPIGAYVTRGAWSFVSAPRLHPPKLLTDVPTDARALSPGDFLLDSFPNLLAPGPMTGAGGPLIVNGRLQPVWFQPVGVDVVSTDLQQESYEGRPVLVWWQGVINGTGAASRGEVVVVDNHYRRIATVTAQGPAGCTGFGCWIISVHDAVISGSDLWVTVYRTVADQDLAPYGGPSLGAVYDSGVQEYNLANPRRPKLMYTWDALDPGGVPNVPLSQSEQPASVLTGPDGSWDAYHLNSVQPLPGGDILVSMRNTWAAYLIDPATNRIVWTLGGKASTFSIPAGARFAWQHDVRLLSGGRVTLFNDDCCELLPGGRFAPPNGPSEGMVLRLNESRHVVSAVAVYAHRPAISVAFLGSMQLLPGGNALVGWGSRPYFSEYSRAGRTVLDAVWPGKDLSYRALYTGDWVGTPYFPPSGAVRTVRHRTTVYASWNGATQVVAWRVLAGADPRRLRPVAARPSTGFETAITLPRSYGAYEVVALNARHRPIGRSRPFRAPGGRHRTGGPPQGY